MHDFCLNNDVQQDASFNVWSLINTIPRKEQEEAQVTSQKRKLAHESYWLFYTLLCIRSDVIIYPCARVFMVCVSV